MLYPPMNENKLPFSIKVQYFNDMHYICIDKNNDFTHTGAKKKKLLCSLLPQSEPECTWEGTQPLGVVWPCRRPPELGGQDSPFSPCYNYIPKCN